MSFSEHLPPSTHLGQKSLVIGAVLVAHAAGLWALQQDSAHAPAQQIVAAEVIAQFIAPPTPEPPAPAPAPAAPPTPKPPAPAPKPSKPASKPQAALPKAIADATPAPSAPVGTLDSAPTPVADTAPPAAPPTAAAAAPSTAARPAGAEVQLPSSNAAYLNNPRPNYPSISRRMAEQGKVLLRVLVNAQGLPEQVEIKESSGFDRLDKAALKAVQRWRFVPGQRNGVPEAMWNIVPVNFVLE